MKQSEAPDVYSKPTIPRLIINNLSKSFGGTRALKRVDLTLYGGEIHGLVGQNGSGKSTLIKILAGYHAPDPGGRIFMNGDSVKLPLLPGAYRRYGMSFVHQQLGLVPSLTVLENLHVDELTLNRRWHIKWKLELNKAKQVLAEFDLKVDPLTKIERLPSGMRALIAIIRAVVVMRKNQGSLKRGLLILDEPTPFLAKSDVEDLFKLMREIVFQGASVLFVSHDIDELLEITDRATVLRDGLMVGNLIKNEASRDDFIKMIIGHPLGSIKKNIGVTSEKTIKAKVEKLSGSTVKDVSITLNKGEIVGITGLLDSGFSDVTKLLFGAIRADDGYLELDGEIYNLRELRPYQAIRSKIILVPADRQKMGCVESLSVAENITLPVLNTKFNSWKLDFRSIYKLALSLIKKFDIRPRDYKMIVHSLSGGNQQKVLLAKWLQTKPSLVLLDEPTQGVDVGSRRQIMLILKEVTDSGAAILWDSSNYEELAMICDRIVILYQGRVTAELKGDNITKDEIAEHCYKRNQ